MEIEDEVNKIFTMFLVMYFLIVILIIENFLRKKKVQKSLDMVISFFLRNVKIFFMFSKKW